jgi:transposase-like protein
MPKTASKIPERFLNPDAARKHLESIRWPDGPVCPHCGVIDQASRIKGGRAGLMFCNACRKQFSVTVGTVFERSHIPLHTWLYANHLLCSSKKGMSAHQLHRILGVTYKTAWFMAHRIREAMKPKNPPPLGGTGATVEVDETYVGRKAGVKRRQGGHAHKIAVLSLVERGGSARSFRVENVSKADIDPIVHRHADRKSRLMTDEATWYADGLGFKAHLTVNHKAGEYWRKSDGAGTNTVEGYFSIFKRGMIGTYQHCGEQHLHRYLNEFDFRYSNRIGLGIDDATRADIALRAIEGKRLTYRRTHQA